MLMCFGKRGREDLKVQTLPLVIQNIHFSIHLLICDLGLVMKTSPGSII